MATLTLIFGFFLAYQWRSQFLFSERYKSLSDLEERLRIFTDVWTGFNCQQFTEEQVFVGHDLLSEDVKQAFDAEYKSYAYVWKKAYRLGCVVKGACLDPDIILREIVDHTVCNNLSGSESNSYEMVLGRLKAFGLTTVNELETSFERLMK